jgi:hypothetical protein
LVFAVKELQGGTLKSSFENTVEDYNVFSPLIVYDPSSPIFYGERRGSEVSQVISDTVSNLLDIIKRKGGKLLIILPDDLYNESLGLKDYVLEVSLKDKVFLTAILREYSKKYELGDDDVKSLVEEILNNFDAAYTLAARIAGQLISSNKYKVHEVSEIIEKSKGNIHKFITWFINYFFDIQSNQPNKLRAKTLVEIFAIRRPLAKVTTQQTPLIPPGIVKLIDELHEPSRMMNDDMVNWLVYRQHDLIEETIGMILRKDNRLCTTSEQETDDKHICPLEPWKNIEVAEELSKMEDEMVAVDYFFKKYGEKLTQALALLGDSCWKRIAYITGLGLAGFNRIIEHKDLSQDIVNTFEKPPIHCEADAYLLVGNRLPILIYLAFRRPINGYKRLDLLTVIAKALEPQSSDMEKELEEIYERTTKRRSIRGWEIIYAQGMVSILANTEKHVNEELASKALKMATYILTATAPSLLLDILSALEPLLEVVPQDYLHLLLRVSSRSDLECTLFILNKLNYIMEKEGKHYNQIKTLVWPLVDAGRIYADLLKRNNVYFYNIFGEVLLRDIIRRILGLLRDNALNKSKLSAIAWAFALSPALINEGLMKLYREELKEVKSLEELVDETFKKLEKMAKNLEELKSDKYFTEYVKCRLLGDPTDRDYVVGVLEAKLELEFMKADEKFSNFELKEAEEFFRKNAEEAKNIEFFQDYLIARGMVLRVKAIKDLKSFNDPIKEQLVKEHEELFKEALNMNMILPLDKKLEVRTVLCNYLVSLALTDEHGEIRRLFKEYYDLFLNADNPYSVLTRLILKVLLKHESGMKNMLKVASEELFDAIKGDVWVPLQPGLRVSLKLAKQEEAVEMCSKLNPEYSYLCSYAIAAAKNNSVAIRSLRGDLIFTFKENVSNKWYLLAGKLNEDLAELTSEFEELVRKLDGPSIVQLIAARTTYASFALLLWSLIDGNYKLAKAHILKLAVYSSTIAVSELGLEIYKAIKEAESAGKSYTDDNNVKLSLAKLFFYFI